MKNTLFALALATAGCAVLPATGLPAPGAPKERVPFRAGSAGVLHLTELRRRLTVNHGPIVGPTLTSAEMALQLLRYPYQQRFGAPPGGTLADVFTTTYSIAQVQGWLVVKQHG